MAKDGVTEITVSGGEPTMHPNFLEIVQYIQNKKMRLTVLTNSERFSDERFADAFLDIANSAFIKIITTLHSEKAIEHEAENQTKGSFKRTVQGLLKLSERGIRVIVKHCITKKNYKDPDLEEKIEEILTENELYYEKSEVWIESEKLYEVLYTVTV